MRRRSRNVTRFSAWVGDVSVAGVVDVLNAYTTITPAAVYSWLSGDREPRLSTAAYIVRASGGKVTLEDIVQHREEVKHH